MKKVECFKCDHCHDIYETEGECKACEESHAGYDDLEIYDVRHEPQSTMYGYPEIIHVCIKSRSGSAAAYVKEREGSIEGFDLLNKAIDDL